MVLPEVGAASIVIGVMARARLNPTSVDWGGVPYDVIRRQENEAVVFDVRAADGKIVESLAGSTDLACDPPYLMLIDIDDDGTLDLYHHHCGGHGYLRYRANGKRLEYVNLGQWDPADAPAVSSFWGREIAGGGLRLIAGGAGLTFVSLVALLVATMMLRPLRRRKGEGEEPPDRG